MKLLLLLITFFLISCNNQASKDDGNELSEQTLRDRVNAKMVFVEGGTFMMGQTTVEYEDNETEEASQSTRASSDSQDDDFPRVDELPIHEVTVSDFYISKFEVTQELWLEVMGENPSYFPEGGDYPVENISWDEAQNFIERLNELTGEDYRLPTEAEWEYAARGGKNCNGYRYSGSDEVDLVAWYVADELAQPSPVGRKQPNELGLYDMSGNIFEWVFDWYGAYTNEAQVNPKGYSSGKHHVLRGGSWMHSSNGCRVSFRSRIETTHLNKCGLRIAKGIALEDLPYTESEVVLTDIFSSEQGTFNSVILPYRKAVIGDVSAETPGALVIYLHGGSSKGNDNVAQLAEPGIEVIYKYMCDNQICATMLVPQCPSSSSWGKAMNKTIKGLLDFCIDTGSIDMNRIYIFGGSMGGSGTWSIVSTYPGLFTAAMPVAGNTTSAVAENVAKTNIYTVMGSDDTLMKVEQVQEFVKELENAGGVVKLDVEDGWDHQTTCKFAYTETRLDWVFAKSK